MELELILKIFERLYRKAATGIFKGLPPKHSQVELMANAIDVFHERGYHAAAHRLDEKMCEWCELLIDA
ncbi:hypothetical protein MHM93_07780 [Pseudoalteromonas sp. MM17-2]|uniref:hypothetical protein n=1 Tax=Pseudoalteromonas sp. MM17-2 TaxID=2917753 RepID=UPI001EF706D0|nr:hypothetical protein [Pseudoalteromonas sp. MM17-2]MCG7544079.1 hypothetical protein [Pseudoalteromonas sp. MM17-2]